MSETARVDRAEIGHQHRNDGHKRGNQVVLRSGLRGRPDHRLVGHGRINAVAIGLAQNRIVIVIGAATFTTAAPELGRSGSRSSPAAARHGPLDALRPVAVSAEHPRP